MSESEQKAYPSSEAVNQEIGLNDAVSHDGSVNQRIQSLLSVTRADIWSPIILTVSNNLFMDKLLAEDILGFIIRAIVAVWGAFLVFYTIYNHTSTKTEFLDLTWMVLLSNALFERQFWKQRQWNWIRPIGLIIGYLVLIEIVMLPFHFLTDYLTVNVTFVIIHLIFGLICFVEVHRVVKKKHGAVIKSEVLRLAALRDQLSLENA